MNKIDFCLTAVLPRLLYEEQVADKDLEVGGFPFHCLSKRHKTRGTFDLRSLIDKTLVKTKPVLFLAPICICSFAFILVFFLVLY